MVETDGDELGVMVMLQDKPLPGFRGGREQTRQDIKMF